MERMRKRKKITILVMVFFSVFIFSILYRLQAQCSFFMFYPKVRFSIPCLQNNALHTNSKETSESRNSAVTKDCAVTKDMGAWTIHPDGRLGNQMGQYATLYALAKANGRQPYILPEMHNYLAPIFKITLPVLQRNTAGSIAFKEYWIHDWMSEEYNHIDETYLKLTGFPCSWTFYHHLRDEILKEFTIHDHLKNEANQVLQRIKGSKGKVTYIGIHVRRGDYIDIMPNVWKGVIGDRGYLEKAMGYFRKKYKEPVFVVTSNGMNWCKQNIDNSRGDVYFSGDGNESTPGKDFALLASCNHTIMTIGTFGYWASYLVGGETVYLTNFTLPDSEFLKIFHYDAAYLPEWIGIAADLSPLLH
ncbi:galactoside alpha-(1,2)-fucosyltransferase 2-like [Spea bombifrons]|uniref:galactoside alpha-(1,2)-fucosyltransferase 2-like n=1 Tax=Spea bombifrons TaxID=233779 RepID=UPI00234BDEDE|nr:galactoside alpha-(1,2)-fucosyltransferase 2-like [Spea bombifrons]